MLAYLKEYFTAGKLNISLNWVTYVVEMWKKNWNWCLLGREKPENVFWSYMDEKHQIPECTCFVALSPLPSHRGIQLNSSVFYCHFNHIHGTTFHRDSSGVTHLTYIKTTLYKNDIRNRLHLVHTLYRLRKVQLTHTSISAWWAVNTEHKHSRELACNVEWSAFNSHKLHQQLAVKWIQITTFLRHSVLTQPTSFTWRQSISSSEG